jgi:hypothetical protein
VYESAVPVADADVTGMSVHDTTPASVSNERFPSSSDEIEVTDVEASKMIPPFPTTRLPTIVEVAVVDDVVINDEKSSPVTPVYVDDPKTNAPV